jgi:tRNA dimethylallyltransferase
MTKRPALIAICGSTASGKSALAHHLALTHRDVELISIDAFGVYRGMNIGTASPTAHERSEVRYHMVDLVDPSEDFSVTDFQQAFRAVRADLAGRGVTGILVGGTGLYHRMVIDDLTPPGQWPEIKASLEKEVLATGPEPLHARLCELDPIAAARMEPSNTRRILRALEVCLGSGERFSSFGPGLDAYPENPIVQFGLRWPMATLETRIRDRVEAMVAAGWRDEVRHLMEHGGLSRTAAQAVGYREMMQVATGELSLADAVEQITLRTRQLAVRQLRWFRRDPRLRWVDVESDPIGEAADVFSAVLSA